MCLPARRLSHHTHSGNEEMIYIIDGAEGAQVWKGRTCGHHGNGHRVSARSGGSSPAYQHGGQGTSLPGCQYDGVPRSLRVPDSNKVGAYATAAVGQQVGFRALYVKDKNVNYYEGEDGKEIERVKRSLQKHDDALSFNLQIFPLQESVEVSGLISPSRIIFMLSSMTSPPWSRSLMSVLHHLRKVRPGRQNRSLPLEESEPVLCRRGWRWWRSAGDPTH